MNLTQAKALFFAQYLWQEILHWEHYQSSGQYGTLNGIRIDSCCSETHNSHILLRTVSQLTDEEVYAIGNYLRPSKFFTINRYKSDIHITWSDDYVFNIYDDCSFGWDELNLDWEEVEVFNILKLYGVMLPFTFLDEDGNPVTKRPIEITALGWAKIKTT